MANTYDVGDKVRMSAAFTSSGAATDPTGLTFKIKVPAGTVTTYVYGTDAELVKDSTGNYHVDFTVAASGRHVYRFAGTGVVTAAGESNFEVRDGELD